jgi:YebC/PmpR family DNA-binding regulatory protein
MPYDNIDRAIKRGAGTLEGAILEEMVMEGYSAGGAAIMVQAVTDNRNRTVSDIRNVFNKNGGSLGAAGCVSWIFETKGVIVVNAPAEIEPDEIALTAIDAGAEDVKEEKRYLEVYTKPEDFEKVRTALKAKNIPITSAEISLTPKTTATLDEKGALQTLKLLDKLEDLDEVQSVASNGDFTDDILEKFHAGQASK